MKNKKIIKILTILILVFAPLLFAALPLHAQSLDVQFEREPLFGEVNFLPGDSKSGDAYVINGTDETQEVYVESVNGFDPDGLGNQMQLVIRAQSEVIYSGNFASFLSSGAVPLTELTSGESITYTFEVSFIDTTDNDYQGKSLGFDLCLGFSGGNLQCSDTVIGEENGGSDENSSSGRGSGGGYAQLRITGEEAQVFSVSDGGVAVISWTTNKLATSRVIYGLKSLGPNYPECLTGGPCYNLDISDTPNYGYPNSSDQINTKVTNHSVVITGLTPGQSYSYRVVSSASPDTVGYEYGFVVTESSSSEVALTDSPQTETILTLPSPLGNDANPEDNRDVKEEEMMLGLALLGFAGDWWVTALLFAIIVISVWLLFKKRARKG